jgi:hypothetical protein
MDAARRRELKRLGKAEVERRSAEVNAALALANPASAGSDEWARGYRDGVYRERWLKRKLPILHHRELQRLFVVQGTSDSGWTPYPGGYILCALCGSAVPSYLPWRVFYWKACACGNIRWRQILGWRRGRAEDPTNVVPISLIGRAKAPQPPSAHLQAAPPPDRDLR